MKRFDRLIPYAILTMTGLTLYSGGLKHGFIEIDDGGQVLQNPFVQELTFESIYGMCSSSVLSMYQPLTSLLYAIIVRIWGNHPEAFHRLSLAFHILNSFLVFHLSRQLIFFTRQQEQEKGSDEKYFFIALIFLIHPLMVEPVMWISCLSTLTFAFFYFLSLSLYIKERISGNKVLYSLSVVTFFLGCLCKVQIVPLVAFLPVVDLFHSRKLPSWEDALRYIPFFAQAFIFLWIALLFRGDQNGFPGHDYYASLLTFAQITWYPFTLLFPYQLGILYDWPPTLMSPFVIGGTFGFVGITLLLLILRKSKVILIGGAFYITNIMLHTALFTTLLAPYADRYAYVSSIGVLVAIIGNLSRKTIRVIRIPLYLLALFYGCISWTYIEVWKDTTTLWSNNLLHQDATFSNGMRGALYYKSGKLNKAKKDFLKVDQNPDSRIDPEKYAYLYTALGVILAGEDPDAALTYFKKTLRFKPSTAATLNLVNMHLRLKDFRTAKVLLERLVASEKTDRQAHSMLVNLYFQLHKFQEATELLTHVLKVYPDDVVFLKQRALLLIKQGQITAAKRDITRLGTLTNNSGSDRIHEELKRLISQYPLKE